MVAILENFNQLEHSASSKNAKADKPSISRTQKRARAEIKKRVENRIKKKLEFLNYSGADKSELTLVFARDMEQLGAIVDQWIEFVSSFQRETFIDLRGRRYLDDTQKQEIATDIDSLFSKAKTIEVTDNNTLVDSIFALDFEEMKDRLGTQLDETVRSIVKQFFNQLYELKARNILGGLSWGSDVSCQFFDWNHQIEIIAGEEFDRTVQNGNFIINEKGMSGIEMLHTAARREQHLMDAKADMVHEFSGEVPKAFKRVVKQLPECLMPEIRIISGEAFRNEKVRHCLKRKKWGETVVESTVLRDIRVHYDPAIAISDIVLFAWDADDTVANAKNDSSIEKVLWAICLSVAAVVMFHLLASQSLSIRGLLSVPLMLGSGWLSAIAYRERMQFQRREINKKAEKIAFAGTVCFAATLVMLSLVISSGNWIALLAAIPLTVALVKSAMFVLNQIQK